MAHDYLPVRRDQQFLLPVCMRDWLGEGHLAWFVIDVVARLDTGVLHARHPNDGVGRPAYDPAMMLALLLYAYATGTRSSRRMEANCRTDAAYKVICGGLIPDHSTICRFIVDHEASMEALFVSGLRLCAAAGLVDLSVLALDGTKMGSDAALDANRSRAWVQARVREVMAATVASEAAEADPAQASLLDLDALGQVVTVPGRLRRLLNAQAQLDAEDAAAAAEATAQREAARQAAEEGRRPRGRPPADPRAALARAEACHDAELARAQARAAKRAAREAAAEAAGVRLPGPGVKPGPGVGLARAQANLAAARAAAAAAPSPERRVNITDPESRIMKTATGWVQGYNAQAIVTRAHIVVATCVSQNANDVELFVPMLESLQLSVVRADITDSTDLVLADAGYWSEYNATVEGPDRLIATVKDYKQRRAAREAGTTTGDPPEGASALEAMEHRLRTAEGSAAYAQRSHTVEPVFGDHKENHGWRRFRRRGLKAAAAEWSFMNLTGNLTKLYQHSPTQPQPIG